MDYGITVDYGISDWQILSRVNGKASVKIGGTFVPDKQNRIYVRVIDEKSASPVIPWLEAEIEGENTWSANLSDIPEGGLYTLETINRTEDKQWIENGSRGQVVSHFGVGDIFLIAGQSNAAGTGLGIGEDAPTIGISNFKNSEKWELATHPLKDRHSPFLSFARKLYENTNIPIGLCDFAVGGVTISRWIKSGEGDLYNEMIDVSKKNNIIPKAILFYQGESDAEPGLSDKYENRFGEFVNEVRKDFENPDLPIYTFQLNAHLDCRPDWEMHDNHWDTIREIQRRQADIYKNLYVIPTIDIPMSDGIHNSRGGNIILGERLGNYVLKYSYDKRIFATAPKLKSISFKSDTRIDIKYENILSMIMVYHADGEHVPLRIKDDLGDVKIKSVKENYDTIELELARSCKGDTFVSCQTGARCKRYIQDLATNIPVLGFLDVKVN